MRLTSKLLTGVVMASAIMAMAASAQASTILGSIYENDTTGAQDATPANVPATTPNVTFTAPDPLNFSSGSLYTIGEFLASGNGSTVLTGAGARQHARQHVVQLHRHRLGDQRRDLHRRA